MNILFPIHHFTDDPKSGIETGMWNFPKHLALKGHKVFVVATSVNLVNETKKTLKEKNIFLYQIYNYKTHGVGYTEAFMTFVFSAFLRVFYKFDWIFIVDEASTPFSRFKFGAKLASRILTPRNKEMVNFFNSGDWLYDRQRKDVGEGVDSTRDHLIYRISRFISIKIWYKFFPVKEIGENSDILFCEGKNTLNYYKKEKNKNAVYLPLGIEKERFDGYKGDIPRNKDEFIFIFVGSRIIKSKGIYYLIESFKNLNKIYPDTRLWLIGDAFGEYKEKLINGIKGFEDKIDLLGKQPRESIVRYMKSCDAVVDPMVWANFSSVSLEALYCKKPLITPLLGNSKDFVEDGVSGFLVDSRDVVLMAEKMKYFYLNRDESRKMGEEGFKFVNNYLTWDKVVKIVEDNMIFLNDKKKIRKLNKIYENFSY